MVDPNMAVEQCWNNYSLLTPKSEFVFHVLVEELWPLLKYAQHPHILPTRQAYSEWMAPTEEHLWYANMLSFPAAFVHSQMFLFLCQCKIGKLLPWKKVLFKKTLKKFLVAIAYLQIAYTI